MRGSRQCLRSLEAECQTGQAEGASSIEIGERLDT
jgi:hypothetical protein